MKVLVLFIAFVLVGCSSPPRDIDWHEVTKKIEAKIYDELADAMDKACRNKPPNESVVVEFTAEAVRDAAQRTVQFGNLSVGEAFHTLVVRCAREQQAVSELSPFYFQSGWRPGECPSKRSEMGCPPDGWTLTPGTWLWEYDQRWVQDMIDSLQGD
jgi:hypothetical protein